MGRSSARCTLLVGLTAGGALGCSAIWGIDDLRFDPATATSTSSSGTGGAGGGTGGSAGGGAAPCADRLDVPPVVINVEQGAVTAPAGIAARAGMVGSVWQLDTSTVVVVFTDTNGMSLYQDGTSPVENLPSFQPSIAAGPSHFAIAFPRLSDVEMRFFDPAEITIQPPRLQVQLLATQMGTPTQAHVVAGQGDTFFLAASRDSGDFFHAAIAQVSSMWTASAASPFTVGSACCCNARTWAAAGTSPLQVAWQAACMTTGWELERFDAMGMTLGATRLPSTNSVPPAFGLVLEDDVVFASCSEIVRVDAGGNELTRTALPGFPGECAVASTGRELRWAQSNFARIEWHALDPASGIGAELLAIDTGNVLIPAPVVAWDGSGFALMWSQADDIGYARIACD